jgi:hypothetical protein
MQPSTAALFDPVALAAMRRECRVALSQILLECEQARPSSVTLELAASLVARRIPTTLVVDARPTILLAKALAEVLRCDDLLRPSFRAVLIDTLVARARELRELLEVTP